ncbi:MAG: hypothetical protein JXB88_18745 [Spirochaetales bacterium]|nr:hypothetical protein [Spirochaetales bacterium]
MWNDPIVEEVRKAGKKLSDNCDNDIHEFAHTIRQYKKKRKKEGWKFVSKKDMNS